MSTGLSTCISGHLLGESCPLYFSLVLVAISWERDVLLAFRLLVRSSAGKETSSGLSVCIGDHLLEKSCPLGFPFVLVVICRIELSCWLSVCFLWTFHLCRWPSAGRELSSRLSACVGGHLLGKSCPLHFSLVLVAICW